MRITPRLIENIAIMIVVIILSMLLTVFVVNLAKRWTEVGVLSEKTKSCAELGLEIRYALLDNQAGYMSDGRCYYNVPVRLGNGDMFRVPVEADKFLDAVRTR